MINELRHKKTCPFPLFSPDSSEKSSNSDGASLIIREDQIFTTSDNIYLKAEIYKTHRKDCKRVVCRKERKLALQGELELVVEEKDDLNAELNSSLSKEENQKKSCEKVCQ